MLLCICVLFLLLPPLPAGALTTYVDDMSDLGSNNIKSCTGLVPISSSTIPPVVRGTIQGQNAATPASATHPVGSVEYRVQGADTVSVGIYTAQGTFVTHLDDDGVYALGAYCNNIQGALSGKTLHHAQYSMSDYNVYYRSGTRLYRLLDDGRGYYLFEPAAGGGELVDYGVNVYAGPSAGRLTRVELTPAASQSRKLQANWSGSYCYEELSYTLPASTAYVRVEINDYAAVDRLYPNGQTVQNPPQTGMRCVLSSVSFSGSGLVLGIPEPAVPESTIPGASSSSGNASSSRRSGSSRQSASSSASAAAGGNSSKFQGEITSTASGTRAGGSTGSGASREEAHSESAEALSPKVEKASPVQVFRVEPGGTGRAAWGITAYIAVVCALVVILLLRGKGG